VSNERRLLSAESVVELTAVQAAAAEEATAAATEPQSQAPSFMGFVQELMKWPFK
jgi:hypothetical protein